MPELIPFTLMVETSLLPPLEKAAWHERRSLSGFIEMAGERYINRHKLTRRVAKKGDRSPAPRILRHYTFTERFYRLLDKCAALGYSKAWIIEEALREELNGVS